MERTTLALFLASGLCSLTNVILAVASARGLIFELSRRRFVVPLMIPVALSLLFQIGSNAAATRIVYLGQGNSALKAVVIALWITTGLFLWNAWLSLKRYGTVADAHERWHRRMKSASRVMKCNAPEADRAVDKDAAAESEDEQKWLLRLAEIFSAVMRFDLSASDIFFGVILTSARQAMARRQEEEEGGKPSGPVVPPAQSRAAAYATTDESEATAAELEGRKLSAMEAGSLTERPSMQVLEEALHYLPFAASVYGVPMLLWLEIRMGAGLLGGLFKFLCCCLYRVKDESDPSLFHSVSSASPSVSKARVSWRKRAISLLCKVPPSHILYQNLDNQALGKLPFIIVRDAQRQALVVAIRGTMSGSDVATDLVCDAASITRAFDRDLCARVLGRAPDDRRDYAHYGMLKAAALIVKELLALGLVDGQFGHVTGPMKKLQLVVCGHSLGAGAAGLVGLFLSAHVPDLKIWAFEPPGALVSPSLLEVLQRHATCLVNHEDIICRLSVRNVNAVCEEVVTSLGLCRRSKAALVRMHWFGGKWSDRKREDVFFASEEEAPEECRTLCRRMLAGDGDKVEANRYALCDNVPVEAVPEGHGFHRLVAPPLYIPGRAVWLRPAPAAEPSDMKRAETFMFRLGQRLQRRKVSGGGAEAGGPRWAAEWVQPEALSREEIILSGNCFLDHLPDECIQSVRKALERM